MTTKLTPRQLETLHELDRRGWTLSHRVAQRLQRLGLIHIWGAVLHHHQVTAPTRATLEPPAAEFIDHRETV